MDDEARCDYCRLPRPLGVVEGEFQGDTYEFCSAHCRDAMLDADRVFSRYHGHRRFSPGVEAIDEALPQGCPRNSFVLVSAQAGTRDSALQAELVWRTLQRDEPVVIVAFQEPPASLVERFLALDWNVLPHLESGQLQVVDCFTYRMANPSRSGGQRSPWNRHLEAAVAPATEAVHDAADVAEVTNKLENCLDAAEMVERGLVVVDSLTEFGTLVQPVQAYDFVKDLRADVSKGRFVPVFAGATFSGDGDEFPHDLAYVTDGVIDLQFDGDAVEDGLVKRLRVRKLEGVLSYQRWRAFEFTAGTGMVAFDPQEELDDAEEGGETDAESDGTDDPGDPGAASDDRGTDDPQAVDPSGADVDEGRAADSGSDGGE